MAALNDPGRLSPAIAFGSARGALPMPVNGVKIRDFGAADGIGGVGTRHFGRHPARRPGYHPLRRLGGLCRAVPILRATLDPECRRRVSCRARGDGTDFRRHRPVCTDRRARRGHGERHGAGGSRRLQWGPANRCFTWNFEKTGLPSIPARGGPKMKVRRSADDAQDIPRSPGCRRRRGTHSVRGSAAHHVRRHEREGGGVHRHLPATSTCSATCSSACAPTMSNSPMTPSWSKPRSTACWPASIRIRASWTPRASATCRCRPAANSAVSASK